MKITWYGESCFLLESSYSNKIVFSPNNTYLNNCNFNNSSLFIYNSTQISSELPKKYLNRIKIINSLIPYKDDKIQLSSYSSFKDNINGLKRGPNIIYKLIIDNLLIIHLGDLGSLPESSILTSLHDADILFIPVGGNICIDASTASKLINILSPKYIFPMNYKTCNSSFYFDGPHKFITTQKKVVKFNSSSIYLNDLKKLEANSTIILNNLK